MKKIEVWVALLLLLQQAGFAVNSQDVISAKNEQMLQVENDYLRIKLMPTAGGRIMSLVFKPFDVQLTNPDSGCLTDNIWNIESSRFFLSKKPYQTVERKKNREIVIEMKGNASGGGVDFLEISKSVKISDTNAAITVDYEFHNMPQAMTALDYGFWFHNTLGVFGKDSTYYYPADNGIIAVTSKMQELSNDRWFFRPARGWCAVNSTDGTGIAAVMDYSHLKCFYSWYEKTGTTASLEWRFEKIKLAEGERFKTQIKLIPFYGLPLVSGAGQYVVGSLMVDAEEIEVGETVPLNISVYSALKQKVQLEIRSKKIGNKNWKTLGKKELIFNAPSTVKKAALDYKVSAEGGYAIEVIVYNGNKELARLNALLVCEDLDGEYKIAALKKKSLVKKKKVDLSNYDLSQDTKHINWANPYCRGKTKILALTGYQNMREVSSLAERISLDPHVSFLCINHRPIFLVGDDYGQTTQSDIFDSLNRKLDEEYDVILIGGVPWDYFPKGIRNKITAMVKSGTGLVYIDPTTSTGTLEAISPLFDPEESIIREIPQSSGSSVLTDGIPFELFPASDCRKFKSKGIVLAKVGDSPYLAVRKIGKGKVVALAYKTLAGFNSSGAGLTPQIGVTEIGLSTVPEIKPYALLGDYWEYYFSLLSKCIVFAADRLPPVRISSLKAKVKANGIIHITLNTSSDIDRSVVFAVAKYNRYSKLMGSKNIDKQLIKGKNDISLEIPATMYAGQQTINIIIKDGNQNVLNWGTVGVLVEPNASLSEIKLDKEFYKYGETAHAAITTIGKTGDNLSVICELFDSYGRAIFYQKANLENLSFSIPLNNEILSRLYTLRAVLLDGKETVDLMERDLIVTPNKNQLEWDDYEPGIWLTSYAGMGIRQYLLPQLASKLKELGIKTIIANFRSLDVGFAIKNNFNPTVLEGVGLTRCEEPKEYLATGDKMKLVRNPCLSDPEFLNRRKNVFTEISKAMSRYAPRFYWLGDEQSITGYSGKPIDFCFSKYCLTLFRHELKVEYVTLGALNAAWGTDFTAWENVVPMTRQEAWRRSDKNYSPWSDHLGFMDSRLEYVLKLAGESCRENDTNTKIFMSGTQEPTAYGGMDWWRQMKHFDGVMNYNNGGQRDLQRSFKPEADILHWGMGYSKKGGNLCYTLWETLFMGEKGVMGFHQPSMIGPDMTFSIGAEDAKKTLNQLTGGIGKHFINNLKAPADIAILYSQSSIRAAFINKQREQHRKLREKYIDLCRNCGINFDFISYEQLAAGILSKREYKAIVLPNSASLSKEEVRSIISFSKKHGVVIAEGKPALMDEHCCPYNKLPLADIFDDRRCFMDKTLDTEYSGALLYPLAEKNAKIIKSQQKIFLERLKKAGIFPAATIIDNDGKQIRNADIYLKKDSAGNTYICVITPTDKNRKVIFKFSKKSHIYEIRTNQYLGNSDSAELFFSNSNPYVFALLDSQPKELNIDINQDGGCVNIDISQQDGVDNIVNLQVIDPDKQDVLCYKQNIVLKNGKGNSKIPFALNDKNGKWILKFKDIITGNNVIKTICL